MTRRILALAAGLLLTSCIENATGPWDQWQAHGRAPIAISPENAVRRLQWTWNARNIDTCRTLFSGDYTFDFAPYDSAGNPWHGMPWLREDEIVSSLHAFVPTPGKPRVLSLDVDMDRALVAVPDPRPGMTPKWHRRVSVQARLRASIVVSGRRQMISIPSQCAFYLVRGDSASFPPEMVAQGYAPDSTIWYVQRWEELTAPPTVSLPPGVPVTWGAFKAMFR